MIMKIMKKTSCPVGAENSPRRRMLLTDNDLDFDGRGFGRSERHLESPIRSLESTIRGLD
jgi:hypothetical protein